MHSLLVSKYRKDDHVAMRNFECPLGKTSGEGEIRVLLAIQVTVDNLFMTTIKIISFQH